MTTSKLSYSGVSTRPSHSKNKSLHEAKDLLPKNIYSNSTIHSNQSPTFTFETHTRGQRDLLSKNKVTYSLFDEVNAGGKSSYANARSLLNKIKEEPTPSRYESKIEKGHQRVKSSIIDMYPSKYFSTIERLEEDEKPTCGTSFGRYQGNNSRGGPLSHDPLHAKGSTDELVNRLIEEHRLAKERENSLQRDEALGTKEGRRLGDFLSKNGGFLKEKTSPDGLRPKMKELSTDVDLGGAGYEKRSAAAVKLMMSQSPKEGIMEETISPKGGEYLNNLDGYLDYLRCPSRTNRRLSNNEVNGEEKVRSLEEEVREADMKFMKKQIEDVNSKLNEVTKINMKLMKEFSSMLIREQESSQKLGNLEEKFGQLRNKNKKYKKELRYTIELLEKERIENQQNLLALKKVLANDINHALHTKTKNHNYGSHKDLLIHHHRDRSGPRHLEVDTSMKQQSRKSSEKRQSQKRPENISVGPNALLFANYGSGSPYVMGKSDDSEVADEIEEEDEKLQTTEQDTDEGGYTATTTGKKQYSRSPQKGNKEEQIRMLQEKIAEVMESRNSPVKYGQGQQERVAQNQVWPKNIETMSQNYVKQGKSKHASSKHLGSKESTDYHSKAQSTYHSRGEANFE